MTELWQHFASENIFWLGLTLAIYLFGHFLYRKSRFFPLLSPIIVSVVLLIAVLALSDTPYETYFEGAQTIHLLLGPATVALAIPLFDQRARLIQLFVPLVTGLVVGGVVAVLSVIVIGVLCGLSTETLLSLVPKSVTTPIAMGISGLLTAFLAPYLGVPVLEWLTR